MNKLRVLLADDHKMVREGLKSLVNSQPDMEVVGEADNGRAAIALAQELKPDVVVMDVSMPELNGLEATKKLVRLSPEIKVLTLTRHADDGYLQQLLRAGASGYVLKLSAADELVVRFESAPGNRGTIVHVDIEYNPPGGVVGTAVAKLFGEEPGQQIYDDLRNLKQVMEVGEVVVSDGTVWDNGLLTQRPAQPVSGADLAQSQGAD